MSEETIERIEQYLNGELSKEQKEAFDAELRTNDELQKQLAFMQALPMAVQASAEGSMRKQLKELESELPKVQNQKSDDGEAPKLIPITRWMQYAVAASVLLLIGLFIFKEQIFKDPTVNMPMADKIKNNDTLSLSQQTKQIATYDVGVKSIADGSIGFVKSTLEKKVTVVVEVDSMLKQKQGEVLTGKGAGPVAKTYRYGLYKFQNDTVFVLTGVLETKISIYYFDVKPETGQLIDSTGQLIEYEKPALRGMFLAGFDNYFRIEKNKEYQPLVLVSATELNLLKFYTK